MRRVLRVLCGGRRIALIALGLALAMSTSCKQDVPPPLPSVVMAVDTDVDALRTVTRLRIDVYGEDGTWLESRDVSRIHAGDWPASFGIVAPDGESKTTTVLVRLRAYPEGATRDYRGNIATPKPTYTLPPVATSIAELCKNLPNLPAKAQLTQRSGFSNITDDGCSSFFTNDDPTGGGSVAASIQIKTQGRYRFDVVRTVPSFAEFVRVSLSLRKTCADDMSEITCVGGLQDLPKQASLILDLAPATYTLMTVGLLGQPTDVTLRWALQTDWGPEIPQTASPTDSTTLIATERPPTFPHLLDVANGSSADITPSQEPLPTATIDRVVRVALTPGKAGYVPVTLHGACAGTEANVPSSGNETTINVGAAQTCVDDPATFAAPPLETVLDALPSTPSQVGTIFGETCAPEDSDDQVVCVPSGTFVFGGSELNGFDDADIPSATPVRIAVMHRFWMDRREATVGRYRQALKSGFKSTAGFAPKVNDGAFSYVPNGDNSKTAGVFTTAPGPREAFPLVVVGWGYARAFCKYYGGDLPSEAQYEYVAGAAGRAYKTTYPWGDDAPTCEHGVFNRPSTFSNHCGGAVSPEAVDSAANKADVNPLGIEALAGNAEEMTRDEAARLDSTCWLAQGAVDPICDNPDTGLYRVARGGSWVKPFLYSRTDSRYKSSTNGVNPDTGFRCIYPQSPTRRWSGL